MSNIIEITNLSKSYKDIKAVSNLSFKVKEGEFFSFLGINGAGKSTTISIMSGQLDFDEGTVIIDNENIKSRNSIATKIGVVFQESYLDKELTVIDNLRYRASLYNIYGDKFNERLKYLSDLFLLNDILNKNLKSLSGGQKRRVDIVRALIHNPKILILDEPTTGLDPHTRKLVWENLHKMRRDTNLTIFLTTHYMEEVEDADYVVILDKGHIVCSGSPYELKNNYAYDYLNIYNKKEEDIKKLNLSYIPINNGYKLKIGDVSKVKDIMLNNQELFDDFEVIKGTMDDVFLNVTGTSLGGE